MSETCYTEPFYPLLFGGDINVYSVARAFHEAYGMKSTCYGKYASGPASHSRIIDYHPCPEIESLEVLCGKVLSFAAAHTDGKVIVLGCGDAYVELIARCMDRFPEHCIAPYSPAEMIDTLIQKDRFYELCDRYGIDRPATFLYTKEMGEDFVLPFDAPYVCKPANSVEYWEHPFPGNDKVFILQTFAELKETLARVYIPGSWSSRSSSPGMTAICAF